MGKIHILQMDWFAQQMAENMDSKWILNVALQFKKDQNKLGTHQRNWRTGFRINCHRLTTNLKPACDVLPPTDSTLNTKQNGKWFLFHHLQNSLLSLCFLSLALSLWQKECNSKRGEEVNNALHPAAASGACSITHTHTRTHTHTDSRSACMLTLSARKGGRWAHKMIHCKNRDTLGVLQLLHTSVHYFSLHKHNDQHFPLLKKRTSVWPKNQHALTRVSHDLKNWGVVVLSSLCVYPNSQSGGATFGSSKAG